MRARATSSAPEVGAPALAAHRHGLPARLERACSASASAERIETFDALDSYAGAPVRRREPSARLERAQRRAALVARCERSCISSSRSARSSRTRPCTCRRRSRRGGCPRRSMRIKSRACSRSTATDPRGARPRDARAVLFVGLAARGAGGPRSRATSTRRPHRARARQGIEDPHRAGRPARAHRARATGSKMRPELAPHGETALFVSRTGKRIEPPRGPGARRITGRARQGAADRRAPAHAAPLVRDAHARVERRSARGAGDARPRELVDDADLHASRLPAPRARLRPGSPARAKRSD